MIYPQKRSLKRGGHIISSYRMNSEMVLGHEMVYPRPEIESLRCSAAKEHRTFRQEPSKNGTSFPIHSIIIIIIICQSVITTQNVIPHLLISLVRLAYSQSSVPSSSGGWWSRISEPRKMPRDEMLWPHAHSISDQKTNEEQNKKK